MLLHPTLRTLPRRARRLMLTVALVGSVLGGCSGDDGSTERADESTTTSSEAGSSGTSTTEVATTVTLDPELEASMKEAMERAEAASLTFDDCPSGWEHLPPAEGDAGPMETCTEVDLDTHLLGLYRSDGFSTSVDPGTLQASSSVTVMDSVDSATKLMEDIGTDRFLSCVNELFNGSTDAYERTGSLTRNETAPSLGDEAVAMSGEFVISPLDDTPDHPVSMAVVAFRTGDMVTVLNSTAVDRNLDETLLRTLLDLLTQRAAQA